MPNPRFVGGDWAGVSVSQASEPDKQADELWFSWFATKGVLGMGREGVVLFAVSRNLLALPQRGSLCQVSVAPDVKTSHTETRQCG